MVNTQLLATVLGSCCYRADVVLKLCASLLFRASYWLFIILNPASCFFTVFKVSPLLWVLCRLTHLRSHDAYEFSPKCLYCEQVILNPRFRVCEILLPVLVCLPLISVSFYTYSAPPQHFTPRATCVLYVLLARAKVCTYMRIWLASPCSNIEALKHIHKDRRRFNL